MSSFLDSLRRDIAEIPFEVPTSSEIHHIVGALIRRLEIAAIHPLLAASPEVEPAHTATVQAQPTGAPPLVAPVAQPLPPQMAAAPAPEANIAAPPITAPPAPVAPVITTDDLSEQLARALEANETLRAEITQMRASFVPQPPTIVTSSELPVDVSLGTASATGSGG